MPKYNKIILERAVRGGFNGEAAENIRFGPVLYFTHYVNIESPIS